MAVVVVAVVVGASKKLWVPVLGTIGAAERNSPPRGPRGGSRAANLGARVPISREVRGVTGPRARPPTVGGLAGGEFGVSGFLAFFS